MATVASGQIPSALRLEPRGVFATGENTTFKTVNPGTGNTEYHFIYDGFSSDDTLDYVIDVDHPDVQKGLLRVYEATTDSLPIKEGGFTWRVNDGTGPNPASGPQIYETPRVHSNSAAVVLFHEHFDPATGVLTLKYKETRNSGSVESRKTYEFWIVGKVLKIHAYADPNVNSRFIYNYDFFQPGASGQTYGAQEQHIPYMDNTPVIRFNPSTAHPAPTMFYAISDDYFASNGVMAGWSLAPAQVPDTWEHWYPLESLQSSASTTSPYQILAVPDETLNLVVTSKVEETFTVIPNYRSPYYALTAGRMMIRGTYQAPGSWDAYKKLYDEFKNCGLTDLAIIQYMSKRTGPPTVLFPMPAEDNSAGIMGCLPGSIVYNPIPSSGLYFVDPLDQQNLGAVQLEFGALTNSARNLGALFAATDCENCMDQWGTNENLPMGDHSHHADYPISVPLHIAGWSIYPPYPQPPIDLGLECDQLATGFNPDWIVRDENGRLKPQWDNSYLLDNTSWADHGFKIGTVDARHIYDLVTQQAQYGRDNYRANAVNYDASHYMPDFYVLDRTHEDPLDPPKKTHTAGDFMKLRTKAVRDIRKFVGGPMYGEPNYWRWAQCYEYGARDGFRDSFPTDDSSVIGNNSLSWVLPDYDLREILPKASGNSGMGEEGIHVENVGFPVDGINGNDGKYLDSYITTSATYGHNGFSGSNGLIAATAITYEGMLRQYAFLGALSRRMAEGSLESVKYYALTSDPVGIDLSHALATGLDLKNPRIQLKFDNGLVFYANHDVALGTPWTVSVPKIGGSLENLVLEPNGFAAGDGSQLFVFFNARPSTYPTPFDYVKYVNRWEMITNRGTNVSHGSGYVGDIYDGFPTTAVMSSFVPADLDLFSAGSIYVDYRFNIAVGAHGGLWTGSGWLHISDSEGDSKIAVANFASPPNPASLTLSCNSSTIYTNKPEGVTARLTFDNGSWQDVTTLASWSATNALVDQSGVVTATTAIPTPFTATVTATYRPPGYSPITKNLTLTVLDGRPTADAGPNLWVHPGTAVSFDATSAADPKQGPVRCEWDFGDGAKAVGTRVDHVFTEPPPTPLRTVTLTVRDVEDNLSTDTAAIAIDWSNTTRWWDNFDDGVLDRYSHLLGGLWGVCAGRLQQLELDAADQQLTVAGSGHVFAASSTGVEFNLLAPSGTNNAGLHVQMANESDTRNQSGYSAVVDGNGLLTLSEGGGGGLFETASIPAFSSSARHDLRLVVKNLAASTLIRAYVDGKKILETTDLSPQSSGYSGLITYDQKAQFDDLRITDRQAPYITASPLDYSSNTPISFFIDDQDLFSDIRQTDATSMVLTIRAEDGPAAGLPRIYNGWSGTSSLATISTLAYENGSPSNSTWACATMTQTLDQTMDSFNLATKTISYEMIVHDKSSPAKYTRKYVRYTRP